MKQPYVICHMIPSLDGRIVTRRWQLAKSAYAAYDRTAQSFNADGWLIGRISMAPYAGKARVPQRKIQEPVARTDFVAPYSARTFAIAIDPAGKLAWSTNAVDGEHVITVVSERVSDDYLAFLRKRGVSYLFGGAETIDLPTVLRKLGRAFGIRKLLLEGGGAINGTFLTANLIDEMSVLLAPAIDGAVGLPTMIDCVPGIDAVRRLKLLACEVLPGDLVWLRYQVKR